MTSLLYPVHVVYDIGNGKEFEFVPAPFIQVDRSVDLSGKKEIGSTFTINFTGTLVAPKHLQGEGIRPRPGNDNHAIPFEYGLVGMNPLERQRRKMEEILSVQGGRFRIYCKNPDSNSVDSTYFEFYPNVIGSVSFQTSPDNWTQTIPYSFQMTMHRTDIFGKDGKPAYLESIDENWTLEFVDEKVFPHILDGTVELNAKGEIRKVTEFDELAQASRVMRLTHTLTATGKKVYGEEKGIDNKSRVDIATDAINRVDTKRHPFHTEYTQGAKLPHEYARDWVLAQLKSTASIDGRDGFWATEADSVFNFAGLTQLAYNHTRQKSENEIAGTYGVTESWLIIVDPDRINEKITDEYTVSYRSDNSGVDTVSIEGTIQGFQEGSIDDGSKRPPKMVPAEDFLHQLIIQNIFYRRARHHLQKIINSENAATTPPGDRQACLNMIPVSRSIRKQLSDGVISYTWEFNTKQNNLFDDTVTETFTTSITYPNDIFANVTIPGRQRGPLFFSANTFSPAKYTLTFELVFKPDCDFAPPVHFLTDKNGATANEPAASQWTSTPPARGDTSLYARVRRSISSKNQYRARIIAITRTHYDFIQNVLGGNVTKLESDNETWNPAESRYSGSLTFTFGSCQSSYYLHSMTKEFENKDKRN